MVKHPLIHSENGIKAHKLVATIDTSSHECGLCGINFNALKKCYFVEVILEKL